MVRTVATTEPEWDAQSYALLAALQDYEDGLCPKHGGPLSECTDPLADPDNPRGTHFYKASVVGRCFVADAQAKAEERLSGEDMPRMGSVIIGVDKIARQTRPAAGRRAR